LAGFQSDGGAFLDLIELAFINGVFRLGARQLLALHLELLVGRRQHQILEGRNLVFIVSILASVTFIIIVCVPFVAELGLRLVFFEPIEDIFHFGAQGIDGVELLVAPLSIILFHDEEELLIYVGVLADLLHLSLQALQLLPYLELFLVFFFELSVFSGGSEDPLHIVAVKVYVFFGDALVEELLELAAEGLGDLEAHRRLVEKLHIRLHMPPESLQEHQTLIK